MFRRVNLLNYHEQMKNERLRQANLKTFINAENKPENPLLRIIITTDALAMDMNKGNVKFAYHFI